MKKFELDLHIGRVLKMVRELKDLKQQSVAMAICSDPSTLSRIEKAEVTVTPGQLEVLAEALQTHMLEIIRLAILSNEFANGKGSYALTLPHLEALFPKEPGRLHLSESELTLLISRFGTPPPEISAPKIPFKLSRVR